MAGPDLLESTRPPAEGAGVHPRRRPAHARLLLWALGALVVVALVTDKGLVTDRGPARGADAQSPPPRRGPSHPSVRLDTVPGGWLVVGRVDGFGAQAQTATVQWPAGAQVALLVRCPSGPALVRVNFAGREPVRATACTPAGTLVSTADMPELVVAGGAPVTVRASDDTVGSGAWVVAVLTRVPFSPWSGAS